MEVIGRKHFCSFL